MTRAFALQEARYVTRELELDTGTWEAYGVTVSVPLGSGSGISPR